MNSLEAEYSFLAPTWKLPPVATSSMYSRTYGTTYLPAETGLGPDWPTWNNTMHNARYVPSYVPPTTARRSYPPLINYQRTVPYGIPQSYQAQLPPPQLQLLPPQQQQQQQQQQSYYSSSTDNSGQPGAPHYQPPMDHYVNNSGPDDGLNLTISVHPNNEHDTNPQFYPNRSDYGQPRNPPMNRGLTYAANDQTNIPLPAPQATQKRRVQIVDHNRQTPSTSINDYAHGVNSRNSNPTPTYSYQNRTPDPTLSQPKYKPAPMPIPASGAAPLGSSVSHQRHDYSDDNKHGNIHEYLYGLAAPDPGSYVNAYKNHQRRLQDERVGRKSVMSEYKTFAQNGGFGPNFGNVDYRVNEDKTDTEKKRKTYSKVVRESNQYKIEEQKRFHAVSDQQKNRHVPIPKHQRAREYADKIEKPQHMRPVVRLRDPTSGNVIIRDASREHDQRISS